MTNRGASNGDAPSTRIPSPLPARRIVPSTPPGDFFRCLHTVVGPGGHPGDESQRLSTVLRCAQYRMVAGPMGHGCRLCFLSGLAGVARARCRVECGALRSSSTANSSNRAISPAAGSWPDLDPSQFSRGVGRQKQWRREPPSGPAIASRRSTKRGQSISLRSPSLLPGGFFDFTRRFCRDGHVQSAVTVTQLFAVATLAVVCCGVFCCDSARRGIGI